MSRPRAGAGGGAAPSRTRWTHRPPGAGLHAGHDAAAWPQRPPPPSAGAAAAALRSRRLRCQPQPQPRPQRGRRGRGDPGPPGRSCCLSVLPRPIAQEKSLLQSLLQGRELPARKVCRPTAVPDPSAPGGAEPQPQCEEETGVPQLAATDAAGGPSSAETQAAPRAGGPGTAEEEAPTARPCRPDPG
ncbi:hypothetical protein VULLAG_LOCUS9422 [Vulpes lagopus]